MTARPARLRVALAWLPAIAYTLLIWWLSSQALDIAFIAYVPFADRGVHFIEYAALGFFIVHAVSATWVDRRLGGWIAAVFITAALGLLDEAHQAFVPGRVADVGDLIADALGALLGVGSYAAGSYLRRLTQRAPTPS